MKKLELSEWAAIAEIAGTAAVIVSLFFVVYSINRNTEVMQVTNENFLYQLTDANLESILSKSDFPEIYVKSQGNVELTDVEKIIVDIYIQRFMLRWNLAFDRHQDGMFAADKWEAWDKAYKSGLNLQVLRSWWERFKGDYSGGFVSHIESVLAQK